jgi:hypothetical protein
MRGSGEPQGLAFGTDTRTPRLMSDATRPQVWGAWCNKARGSLSVKDVYPVVTFRADRREAVPDSEGSGPN